MFPSILRWVRVLVAIVLFFCVRYFSAEAISLPLRQLQCGLFNAHLCMSRIYFKVWQAGGNTRTIDRVRGNGSCVFFTDVTSTQFKKDIRLNINIYIQLKLCMCTCIMQYYIFVYACRCIRICVWRENSLIIITIYVIFK